MQMYDFWVNNVLDSHVSIDTEGVSMWAYQLAKPEKRRDRLFGPAFFNQVLGCKLRHRGWIRLVARTDPQATSVQGPFFLGNVLRENQIYAPKRVSLNQRGPYWTKPGYRATSVGIELMWRSWGFTPWPAQVATPVIDWTLIDTNHVYGARVGVAIEGATHTVLRRNRFDQVAKPVVDKGRDTVDTDR